MKGEGGDPIAAAEDAVGMPLPIDKIGDRLGVASWGHGEPER